uniref:Golgin subfamily A member 5-like isoform X1 n=1 Tax=Crassostrea virginica TaxID=6565 RepID=A0A8B8AS40_CRAVI|nr:golgin subfamily A member 5-like isoform X1 [Crassostrea virginica]XP_022293010.1 golgin subfamily A member 5-like isoform X1 [Crassostrea virginica]XP_022293019.1 golgin subfamily A member 5-like isoform X1 [Crassostrea virginica]
MEQITPKSLTYSPNLRSRSPSPSRVNSARSHTRKEDGNESSYLTEVQQSLPTMSTKKTTKTSNSLRKSTGSLAASLGGSGNIKTQKSSTLENIEGEYIKNLQQQIYFLELESNYLREQVKKATEMHPKMTAEAERMLAKLRQLQLEIDDLQLEVKRKDTDLALMNTEKEKLMERLRDEEASRTRDKRMLMDEIVQLKKDKDVMEREISKRDSQLMDAKGELDKSSTALKNADLKMETIRTQLEQRIEAHNLAQITLDEKRSELLSMETQLREVEDKYYNQSLQIQDKVSSELKEEIQLLRQKLKETEMAADQDRFLKVKLSEDSTNLARENAALNQQMIDLKKQLEREKAYREATESRQNQSISEYVQIKDREKEARFELQHSQEALKREQDKVKSLMEQLSKYESVSTTRDLELNTSRSRVAELESLHSSVDKENMQLRKDKVLLVDHVSELQRKLEQKDQEIVLLRSQVQTMEVRLKDLEHLNSLESTVQSQKWEEFEKLAENMRTLSHSMAHSSVSKSRVMQY